MISMFSSQTRVDKLHPNLIACSNSVELYTSEITWSWIVGMIQTWRWWMIIYSCSSGLWIMMQKWWWGMMITSSNLARVDRIFLIIFWWFFWWGMMINLLEWIAWHFSALQWIPAAHQGCTLLDYIPIKILQFNPFYYMGLFWMTLHL